MTRTIHSFLKSFVILPLGYILGGTLSLVLLATVASGQSETSGSTPSGLAPGAPAGSYPLSGFDNVNLFNGHMSFRLPLLGVSGRGSVGYQMALPVEQTWTIFKQVNEITGVVTYHPEPNWWSGFKPGYGAGMMQGRKGGTGSVSCGPFTGLHKYTKGLTRLTFTAGDGTEFELRDQLTGGQPQSPIDCTTGFNRGKVFVTADGTAATFISDSDLTDYARVSEDPIIISPSGYLLMRDGTRYRIVNGTIEWMRDRNGNKLTFLYDSQKRVTSVTDSLNRQITVTYAAQTPGSDVVTYKGSGAAVRTIIVNYDFLQYALRSDQVLQTPKQLFPDTNGSDTTNHNPTVIKSVALPNNRQYQLYYNSYGEVARAVLPTGGAIEYDYAAGLWDGPVSGSFGGGPNGKHVYRRVIERRTYPSGNFGAAYESKTTYSRPESITPTNLGYVVTEQCTPSGSTGVCGGPPALLDKQLHYFYGSARSSFFQDAVSYSGWQEGREYQTDDYDTNGTTILRRTVNTWQQRAAVSWWTGLPEYAPSNDPRLSETTTTLLDTNQVAKQTFSYDDTVPFNNRADVHEYDFGIGAPGQLVRRTHTDYLKTNPVNGYDYACDPTTTCGNNVNISNVIHLRSLPTAQRVFDAAGVEKARATFEYDNYAFDSNHAPLENRPGISGYDVNFSAGYPTRGNATGSTSYLLVNGSVTGSTSAYVTYDIAGNVVRAIDARGYATTFQYDDCFGAPDGNAHLNSPPFELSSVGQTSFAFATSATNAAGHISYAQFDYSTGRSVEGEDPNGVVSSVYSDYDLLDRPTKIVSAVNTTARSQTIFAYDDAARTVTTSSDLTNYTDGVLVSRVFYDGLGRTTETRQYEENGAKYIATQQQYDPLGRAFRTSNPFRPLWPDSETAVWTTTAFDALGRVTSVTTPDNAVVSSYYSGNQVLVKDQAGKERMSQTNALGQLLDVWEITAPDDATEAITFPNRPEVANGYRTKYAYDTLGNLTSVTQRKATTGALQTRTFLYDSLKRLTSASNPESGTITYQYDPNGNLTQKTDPRVTTYFAYDALNRNTEVGYSDGTLGIGRAYDYTNNGKGRLSWEYRSNWTTSGTITSYGYDPLGRINNQNQHYWVNGTWTAPFTTNRAYNLAGHVTSQTYPSLHTVNYSYDSAGRLINFTGNLGDGNGRSYSTGIVYSPLGGMRKEQFGTDTPVYNKSFYNSRGQLAEILASTSYSGPADMNWNRGKLVNWYSAGCGGAPCNNADNNGNLRQQQNFIPHNDQVGSSTSWSQQYDYDSLNRLARVKEYNSFNAQLWQQEYAYDRYGNRTIHQTNTWGPTSGPLIPKPNFGVDPANNNRLTVPAGYTMTYDPAGNVINDNYAGQGQRIYDAENRMTQAWANGQWQAYTYNASGQRVIRKVDGVETWQVYGIDGELLAEYAANGTATSPQKEYGYRNGQLLITADAPQSSSSTPTRVSVSTSNVQSLKIAKPDNLMVGDVLIAIVASSFAYGGGVPTPAGWTLIQSVDQGSQIIKVDTYYHVVNGSEPPSWSWQLGNVAGNPNGNPDAKATGSIIAYRGVNTTTPISAANTQCCTPGTSTSVASINTPTANNLVLAVFAEGQSNSVYTPPAGLTGVVNVTNGEPSWGNHHMFGERLMPTPGPTGHQIATNGQDTGSDVAQLLALQPSSSATITRVNVTTSNTATLNIAKPANLLAGDVLIAIVASSFAYNGVPTPAGWTLIQSVDQGSQIIKVDTYYHVVNGSEPAVWSWQLGSPNGNSNARATGSIIAYRGVNTNAPISALNTQCCTGGTSTSVASINTPTANNLILAVFAEGQSNSVYTPPAGLTGVMNVTNGEPNWGNHHMFGERLMPAAGPTGHQIATNGKDTGSDVAQLIALQPSTGSSVVNLQWLLTDQLGTPRMIFDKTGSLANMKRHDYLPFGEELVAGQGARTIALGYSGDNVRQKFTQKERDIETGLDFFEARYFGSMQGRFTSADPYNPIVDTEDQDEFNEYLSQPQNWNRYAYVWNNPLRYIDPFGEKVYVVTYTTGNWRDNGGDDELRRAAETKAAHIRGQKGFDAKKDTVLVRGVETKEDFKAALKEANGLQKQFGKVEQVALYSHSGSQDGPIFHDRTTGRQTQFGQRELSSLRVNWSGSASAKFYGCYTSPNFGQNFANVQGVPTYGYDKYAYFSNRHDKMVPDQGGGRRPLYLIAADYGDANGIGAAIRYQLGVGRVYPMIRHNPPPKRRPRR